MNRDEAAISALINTWMQATSAGDIDTVLELMTEDVVFMVPGREPFGKSVFANAARSMRGASFSGTSEIMELVVLGDWAFARNRLEVTATPLGAPSVTRQGYTLTLFQKGADGKWRLARDANLLAAAST